MGEVYQNLAELFGDIKTFCLELSIFLTRVFHLQFLRFEEGKGVLVTSLYRKRGKLARRFVHTGMVGIAGAGIMIAPVVAQEFPGSQIDPWEVSNSPAVLSSATSANDVSTTISKESKGEIVEYVVQEGDSVSTIAEKFGISEDTIRWQNDLKSKDAIKVGQTLEILPETGIAHKVVKGDTIYSIAKRYDANPQSILDYPFNTFVNDETFELAIGQEIIVPNGVKPAEVYWSPMARVKQITPDAGSVTASGNFVWPTGGTISQNFVWYHKGVDIANRAAPGVLAADSGTVVAAGWSPYGYGYHVVIDHGNGYRTLYAHLSQIYVNVGQGVNRGAAVGKMGSTGRSTGIHLHFEVIRNGAYLSPLSVLQ